MAHNYLQLSLDVVRALVGPENAQLLQLNASQCGALKMKLLETATSIQDFVDSLSPIDRRLYEKSCKTALQEFYRVVKDAEAIIHSCCDKNWLQAAIKLANNTEAFVDVMFKLDWCTAVLGNLSRDVIPGEWSLPKYGATLIAEVDQAGMMGEMERMLRVDAMDDRKNLRRRLGELQNGTEAVDLRQDIILHLLRITDPAGEDEQKTEKGDFLLTIEPKELRRIEVIGMGAFGSVHKISWLGESFAGKYYGRGCDSIYLKERKILADISHPHVAQVFGCTISDPCCLVMELMHTDLRNHIECFSTSMSCDREALFELPVAVDIMLQIAEGMEYLHRKGIVHRDLKSRDILVNPVSIPEMVDAGYVQVKVAGFSSAIASTGCLAKNHVPETCSLRECFSELEHVGTTAWRAPELGDYESSWGNPFKTDVYSFAITCSEILTGRVPFEHIRRSDLRAFVKEGMRPTLPASLPTSLSSLIECCWDTDARRRPPFSEICAKLRHVKYLLMSVDAPATCEKWEQGQLGVGMSMEVGVDEKPVGQLGGHVSKNEQAVGQIGETPSITIGWRIASEENGVELFFPSAQSMSRIVGVGLEFAKVVMSLSNLEVKIVGIGQKSWEAVLPKFTTVDKKLEVISIATANMRGPGSHKNPTFNAFFSGKESAQKYGVGLCSGNTVHVQSTDVPHEFDYRMVLHELMDYLMVMNVDLAKIGNQCAGGDGAGASSSGGNKSNQANRGDAQIRQNTSYSTSRRSKGKSKSNTDDDEGDDDISPSKRQPQEEEHESAQKKKCEITVRPGPGGKFWNIEDKKLYEAPAQLNDASISPELVFEFDMNGKFGKQISVTTTTTFDLGGPAPRRPFKDSFGWYHDSLMTSLRNQHEVASLQFSDLVMGITKDGKLVLRQTQTSSGNDARGWRVDGQIGFQQTRIGGGFTKNRSTGKTFAREEAYENCTSLDVWRGFIYQDLSAKKRSSAKYEFTCNLPSPLPLAVLEDSNEQLKYLGSGMCGKIEPTFVGVWGIKPEDANTASKYVFDAQRTLNELSKINGETIRSEITQKYHVPMFVNHAMDHLHNVKDNELLGQREILPGVMRVGLVGI
ncbi:unnamed protein product [Sphagnum compactum]